MFSRFAMRASSRVSQVSKHIPTTWTRTMAYANTKFTLNTGAEIPAIGFGTWQDKDAQEDAVHEALKAGYRHIDTARVYAASYRSRPLLTNMILDMVLSER
jgi:predicted aldo/keto reductase-like oxidoreductase